MEKSELRRSLIATRRSIPMDIWQQKSHQLCDRLRHSSLFTEAKTVLAYFSIRQEPDLSPLFTNAKLTNAKFTTAKTWGFPRCVGQSLSWHRWSPQDSLPLQKGTFGILEPHPDAPTLRSEDVELILVPSVACDRHGYRLGYGGGFYDRLLNSAAWADKLTIGIVFDSAYLPALPIDPWDYPLKAVCTETNLFFPVSKSG